MGRAPCCEKVGLKKGKWTAEEDEILIKYIKANGEGSWRSLPKKAGLLRCGKSCRLRWINYLRADLKRGGISAEEEEIIIKMHASFGNRWSLIAGFLPGRTDNEIKNYWNSHLSRRMTTFRRFRESVPLVVDVGKLVGYQRKCGGNSKMGLKITSGNGKMRREKEEKKRSTVVPCEESESMILGSHGGGESVVLDPFEVMESGTLCISEQIESGNNKEIESWMFGPNEETSEEMVRGGMENSEESESGNMGLNEERETGEKGINEERGYSEINGRWVSPPAGSSCDERVNWDLGVLGVEGGELLSWLCDSENWEEEFEGVPEHEQRSFSDWLLSGDTDIL